jgi:hypothetical protein
MGEGKNAVAKYPDKEALRDYIEDIKKQLGRHKDDHSVFFVELLDS